MRQRIPDTCDCAECATNRSLTASSAALLQPARGGSDQLAMKTESQVEHSSFPISGDPRSHHRSIMRSLCSALCARFQIYLLGFCSTLLGAPMHIFFIMGMRCNEFVSLGHRVATVLRTCVGVVCVLRAEAWP